ncbi:MAG: S8 family serine peptidase, partial [Gemmatimonadota bacterium]|nr:S8 family serine peptidase [Gemmatimonadota bacterium]
MDRKQFLLVQSVGLIILLIGLFWNVSATGGTLQAGLQNRLNSMGPDDVETVIVVMANQPSVIQNTTDRYLQLTTLYSEMAQEQSALMAYVTVQQQAGKVSSVHQYKIVNAISITAARDVIEAIAARADVEVVTEDHIIPLPPTSITTGGNQYGIRKIRADSVWTAYNIRGDGIVLGSIDTGVDGTHPDLASKFRGGPKDFYDAIGDSMSAPWDRDSHGTHVHGTMVGGDASGVAIGVAPNAKWIAAGAFDENGGSTTAILRAMGYMADPDGNPQTDDAPDVVNNSWGGGGENNVFKTAIDNWISLGIFPAFANGNSGPGAGTVGYPAYYPQSFGVGATDSVDVIAGFSSRGPAITGEIKPEVSAPGVKILSSLPNGEYGRYSGTSMATPHVSGAIALLKQANPSISIAEIRSVLQTTAVDLGATGEDNDYGHGRIDIFEAVKFVAEGMGTLSGTVTEGAVTFGAQDPVSGATIMVVSQPDSGRKMQTAGDGTYSFLLPAGAYTIQASRDGYATAEDTVSIADDSTKVLNFLLEPAFLQTSHSSFKDTLNAGTTVDHVLTISNPGAGTLKFTVGKTFALSVEGGPKPLPHYTDWLTITPDSGQLNANESLALNVKVNSTGLANFTYTADITLGSNDPNKPSVVLGDTLIVQNAGHGQISVTPSSLTASLEPDSTTVRNITIKNSGAGPLQISNIIDDAGWLSISPRFYLLPPGDSTLVTVTFNAASLVGGSSHAANIKINSTDPNASTVTVPVTLNILAPDLAVSPTSFVFRMDAGKTLDKLLKISNNGNGILRYKVFAKERDSSINYVPLSKAQALNTYRSARKSPGGSSFLTAASQSPIPSSAPKSFESLLADLPDQIKSTGSLKVLVAPADYATKLTALLTAFPDFAKIDYFDGRTGVPPLDTLKLYDVVLTWSFYPYKDAEDMGDVLADYVDQGGSVIMFPFSFYTDTFSLKGRIKEAAYSPFGGGGGGHWYPADLGTHDDSHPFMEEITSVRDPYRDKDLTQNSGSTLVASWSDDELLAGVNGSGNVAVLNTYPGDSYQWEGDVGRLIRNTVVYVAGGGLPWISFSPKTGEVGGSGATDVTVTFDTTDLPDSTYLASIVLESNDPDSVLIIPVDLTVGGFPVVMTDLRTSNQSSQHITVGWKTDLPADGKVYFGLAPDSLDSLAEDSRGVDFNGTVHAVPINDLSANTKYYYKVESAGNEQTEDVNGNPLSFTTTVEVDHAPGLNVTGSIRSAGGIQVNGAHLYLQVSRVTGGQEVISLALSVLTTTANSDISYLLNLGNLKGGNGQPWIVQNLDKITLHAQGGDKGVASKEGITIFDASATHMDLGVLKLRTTSDISLVFPRGFSIGSTPGIPATSLTSADFLERIPAHQVSRWLRDAKQFESSVNVENRIFGTFPIELGDGYFVKVDTIRTYNLSVFSLGDSVVQTQLRQGLNIISTPTGRSYTSHSVMGQIGVASEVVRWLPALQAYESAFELSGGVIIGPDFGIQHGKGYFLRVTADFMWSITGPSSSSQQFATKRLSQSDRLAALSDYPATTLANTTLSKANVSNGGFLGSQVKVANLTPVSATVVWMTRQETMGRLVYGQNDQMDQEMIEKIPGQVHRIELTNLSPETAYSIQVGGETLAFTTPDFSQGMSYTVFGRIADTAGLPSINALVMIRATDESGLSSLPLAVLTDSLGFWNVNLGNLKTAQGAAFVWQAGQLLDIEIANTTDRTALQLEITGESPQSTTLRAASTAATDVPQSFSLTQSYPNPFNPTTTISYAIPKAVHVELSIYNILGQKVAILVNEPQQPGRYEVQWSGRNTANASVASGIYLYRLS